MRHAVVRDGIVENIVEWDGQSEWAPPAEAGVYPTDEAAIGWNFDAGVFSPPPAPLRTMAEVAAARLDEVTAEFNSRVDAGMPYQGGVVQIDDESRGNIQGVAAYADKVVAGVAGFSWPPAMVAKGWRLKDNTYLPMPEPADIYAMAGAVALHYMALRYRAAALKDSIHAAATVEELNAIDITQGWPQ